MEVRRSRMIKVSKKFADRAKPGLRKYKKILESARSRDINEADTVIIVNDFLSDVLGYDKYEEVTSEYCIRSTYCDLAIRLAGQLRFLIEVKAIGKDLHDNHLRQAVDYGANEGVDWVLLTNGIEWQAHRIRFEKPIDHELVFQLDLLDPEAQPVTVIERLFLLSREAAKGQAIDEFRRHREATSRFVLAQVILSDPFLGAVRRELRRISPDVKTTEAEVAELLKTGVLKREVVEGERAKTAAGLVRRAATRKMRKSGSSSVVEPPTDSRDEVEESGQTETQ
jgi:predicted type IV restriction endonuclease